MSLLDRFISRALPFVPKPIVGHFSKPYIAGATVDEAIAVVRALGAQGAMATIDILGALMKLRQACCDPRLVPVGVAREVTESAKFRVLFELLPQLLEQGRRILLFSQFTSMLALISHELAKRKVPFCSLTGESNNRQQIVDEFQSGTVRVFLVSLKAGGTGLNLTGADYVIHYDPWWNPAVQDQATDRAHRIGQKKHVFSYRLITKDSVEEKILMLQENKRHLAKEVLSTDSGIGKRLTYEDLEFLFS